MDFCALPEAALPPAVVSLAVSLEPSAFTFGLERAAAAFAKPSTNAALLLKLFRFKTDESFFVGFCTPPPLTGGEPLGDADNAARRIEAVMPPQLAAQAGLALERSRLSEGTACGATCAAEEAPQWQAWRTPLVFDRPIK